MGRVPLFLLDTDIPDNKDEDRHLTARLYGGDQRTRIRQEIMLGIGGVRALHALGIQPSCSVYQIVDGSRNVANDGVSHKIPACDDLEFVSELCYTIADDPSCNVFDSQLAVVLHQPGPEPLPPIGLDGYRVEAKCVLAATD